MVFERRGKGGYGEAVGRAELEVMMAELLPEARAQMGHVAFDGFVTDAISKEWRERWELRDVAALYRECLASEVVVAAYSEKVRHSSALTPLPWDHALARDHEQRTSARLSADRVPLLAAQVLLRYQPSTGELVLVDDA